MSGDVGDLGHGASNLRAPRYRRAAQIVDVIPPLAHDDAANSARLARRVIERMRRDGCHQFQERLYNCLERKADLDTTRLYLLTHAVAELI